MKTLEVIAASGQSLSCGGGLSILPRDERAVSTKPPARRRLFMLNIGTIAARAARNNPDAITGLRPIRERPKAGESPGTAMLRWLDRAWAGKRRLLFTSSGRGGARITDLGPDTAPYGFGLRQIAAARALAEADGLELHVLAATFQQGEADRRHNIQRDQYARRLRRHVHALGADLRAATGQDAAPPVFIDQLSSAADGTSDEEVPLAQLDVAESGEALLIGPRYHLRDAYGLIDNVHLRPLGYAVLGEMFGKAIARHVEGQPTFLGPDRASMRRDGDVLRFRVAGAVGGLAVADDLPVLPGLGFEWIPREGAGGVGDVAIEGDTVAVTTTGDRRGTLRYALASRGAQQGRPASWGNIRDEDPLESIALPGLRHHGRLVAFEHVLD